MTPTTATTMASNDPAADSEPLDTPPLNVEVLRLLADPTRAAIVALLAVEQLCTCHLVDELGASQTNISNHLRALRHAGIVKAEPAGRFTYYRLQPAILRTLSAQLGDLAQSAVTAEQVRRPCG